MNAYFVYIYYTLYITFLFQYIRVQADQLRFGKTCKRMLQIYLNKKTWSVRIRSSTELNIFATTVPSINSVFILHQAMPSVSLDIRFLVARHPEIERLDVRRLCNSWNDSTNDDRIIQHMRPSSLMDPKKSSGKTLKIYSHLIVKVIIYFNRCSWNCSINRRFLCSWQIVPWKLEGSQIART